MSEEDTVDKVDYYESFEIYKNATNQIIERAKRNRSFSFDDASVDPRRQVIRHKRDLHTDGIVEEKTRKVAGHNLSELKADGYTPEVKRVMFVSPDQVAYKSREEKRHERFLAWCDRWSPEIQKQIDRVDGIEDFKGEGTWINSLAGMQGWINYSLDLQLEISKEAEKIGWSELPPMLDLLYKRRSEVMSFFQQKKREEQQKCKSEWEKLYEIVDEFLPVLHQSTMEMYFRYNQFSTSPHLAYIPLTVGGDTPQGLLNFPLRKLMRSMGVVESRVSIFEVIHKRRKEDYINDVALGICNRLFKKMKHHTKDRTELEGFYRIKSYLEQEKFYSLCLNRYDPCFFLDGIDDLRTTLKEMKDHGATKAEQEGGDPSEEKSS